VPVTLVPGVNHMGMVTDPRALSAIATTISEWLARSEVALRVVDVTTIRKQAENRTPPLLCIAASRYVGVHLRPLHSITRDNSRPPKRRYRYKMCHRFALSYDDNLLTRLYSINKVR
jgi:hypothetical protein